MFNAIPVKILKFIWKHKRLGIDKAKGAKGAILEVSQYTIST
jgi:hypothetical protein